MKHWICIMLLATASSPAADRLNIAEDDAAHSGYGGGWGTGKNVGTGFGAWFLRSSGVGPRDSHAGFFIEADNVQGEISAVALGGKAFSIFANGLGHENAVAFRAFGAPLQVQDAFSLLFQGGTFRQKFESDDERTGAVGFSLRTGTANAETSDLSTGERLRVSNTEGEANYQIIDGESDRDSGVPVNDAGVSATVLLTGPDTYDLEITDLDTNNTHRLQGRKLGGSPGAPIESFAIFNLDAEDGDVRFNGFQVTRPFTSLPR